AMCRGPGNNRLFVVERFGKIFSFENNPQAAQADLLIDVGKTTYGLAVHPQFQQNGYFYVVYILDPAKNEPNGTRLVRFQVDPKNPLGGDRATEKLLLTWPSGGHNGGCLKFGPDGYLYVCTGDSSGINDEALTGQDLGNVSGAILRIDVDQEEGGGPYAVPEDNPFVATKGARPEIWAYGLRQPWKISFDRKTGDLWTGNVGQDLWEQIFIVERGGNYGWSVMEGSRPFRPDRPRGPSPFVQPIVEHDHAEFRSITGGFVYHGSRLQDLTGAYVYGDYDTGKIWMLRYDRRQQRVTENRELLDSQLRLVGFAEDNAGELYLVDHMGGRLSRLEPNPAAGQETDFPRTLSETGLFASVADHRPAAGVIPYSVNAPQWIDGAQKQRFLALPDGLQIEFDGITYPQPAPGAPHGWKFPDGTVLFETISMEMERGNPASRRRLETRLLHFEQLAGDNDFGDQFWRGYTYVWNADQTGAVLLEEPRGLDRVLKIKDPAAPRGIREQTWHFPSRAECTVCHNMAAKYVLGMNTLQMNRDHSYGEVTDNQLRTFEHLKLFTGPLPERPQRLPSLADYREGPDPSRPAAAARAYLHANCSHCHRKWGGGNAEFRLLGNLDVGETGIFGRRPQHGGFYIGGAQLVMPGEPQRSVLYYRMATLGPGHMPRLGSNVVDGRGLQLIYDWIWQLGAIARRPPPSKARREVAALIGQLQAGVADAAERKSRIDRLLSRADSALSLMSAVEFGVILGPARAQAIAAATAGGDPHVRDLFERFVPEIQRTKRLGSSIEPAKILSLAADAAR
ncbi:MAG: PQQ-dependent sugar dehydrogenase, partial [Pirellulales bacterium]